MNDDTNLNYILNKREIPGPSSNLTSRIIMAAKPKYKTSLWIDNLMVEIMNMIILPRPAYALALGLFLGLIMGLEFTMDTTTSASQDLFSFADMADEGDWL